MSIKTNKPSDVIPREYGRRLYVSDKSYAEQIEIPTQKAADDRAEIKHSEFKKPYLSDTYEEMEYFADPPLGYAFAPDPWGFDTPYEDYVPWHLIFHCSTTGDTCYCEDSENCFELSCTYEITKIVVKESKWDVTVSKSRVCITAPEGASGFVEIDVYMRAKRPWTSPHGTSKFVYGTHFGISLSLCPDDECCDAAALAWDSGTSAATVARNASVTVAITDSGDSGPFSWAVSGTGFTLDNATTTGLTNTLNADGTACGLATITVTGCEETSATGYVRCTTGVWVLDTDDFCVNCTGCCQQYAEPCDPCTPDTWEENDADDPRYRYKACGSGCPPSGPDGGPYCQEGGVTDTCDTLCYTLLSDLYTVCVNNIPSGYNTFSVVDRWIWECA